MPTGLAQNLSFILLGEDKSASKTMEGTESTAAKVTGKIGASFNKLGGIIGGEFGEVLSKAGDGITQIGSKGIEMGKSLMVAGGIATAAGVGLMSLASADKQATDQLKASMDSAGESWVDYKDKVDEAIAANQNFGHEGEDTTKALSILTIATGSTQTALDQMSLVADLAAQKHISLEAAASLVAKILGGAGAKTLKQYGITMETVVDQTQQVTAAQDDLTSAQGKLADAQQRLTDLQAIQAAKSELTVSDTIALRNATDKVTEAQAGLTTAQKNLTTAQSSGRSQTDVANKALSELAAKLDGQAKASMNNFGAQVDVVKTKIIDWVQEIAGPLGQALTAIGPILTVAGLAIDLYKTRKIAATIATIAQTDATVAATAATLAETGAQSALNVAMDANPIGLVAGALGILAGVIGAAALVGGVNTLAASTSDYTATLNANTGAITENTRAQVAKDLLDSGALEAANALGISTSLLVDATLGNVEAKDQLKQKTDELNAAMEAEKLTTDGSAAAAAALDAKNLDMVDNLDKVNTSVGLVSAALKQQIADQKLLAGSIDNAAASLDVAERRANEYADALRNIPGQVTTGVYVDSQNSHYAGVPQYAAGGVTTRPHMAVVGESGPEAIIPLNAGLQGLGGGGNTYVTINPQGMVFGTPGEVARQLQTMLINSWKNGGNSKTEFSRAIGVSS